MRALVFILALAACNPHRWPPDELCFHGERVYHHGDQLGALCPAVDRAASCAQETCPAARWGKLFDDLHQVNVDAYPPPLYCAGADEGCQEGTDLRVTTSAVVYDELGHLVWEDCFGRPGERVLDGGGRVYDEDFFSFVVGCRAGAP